MWPALISSLAGSIRQDSQRIWCLATMATHCHQARLHCMPKARSQACAAALCCVQLRLPALLARSLACVGASSCAGMQTSPVAACGKSCRRVGKTGNPLRPLHRQAGTRLTRSQPWPGSIGKMPSVLQRATGSTGRQPIACGVACAAIGKTAKVSEAQLLNTGKKQKSGAQAPHSTGKKGKPCVQRWINTGKRPKSGAQAPHSTGSNKVCRSALRMLQALALLSLLPWPSAIVGKKPRGRSQASAALCLRLSMSAGHPACPPTCYSTKPGQQRCPRTWCLLAGAAHRPSPMHQSSCRRLGLTS